MTTPKKTIWLLLLVFLVMTQSGCTLLQIFPALIKGGFDILGKLLDIAQKLPKPPPRRHSRRLLILNEVIKGTRRKPVNSIKNIRISTYDSVRK